MNLKFHFTKYSVELLNNGELRYYKFYLFGFFARPIKMLPIQQKDIIVSKII